MEDNTKKVNSNKTIIYQIVYQDIVNRIIHTIREEDFKRLCSIVFVCVRDSKELEQIYIPPDKFVVIGRYCRYLDKTRSGVLGGLKYYKFLYNERIVQQIPSNPVLKTYILLTLYKLMETPEYPYYKQIHYFKWLNKNKWIYDYGIVIYWDDEYIVFYSLNKKELREVDKNASHKFQLLETIKL